MQRVTVTLDDDLLEELDRFVEKRGYQTRSEAIRDLTRAGMRQAIETADESRDCVAALVYVYDHETRNLAHRLTAAHHHHHDLSVATMHMHLDHDSCLEVAMLKGATGEVRHFAEHVISERGVRHGRLVMVPIEQGEETHSHGGAPHSHPHVRQA